MTMERKIGEMFKYEGNWYQCVKNIIGNLCIGCSFYKKGMVCCECPIDCEGVIFKKLEPVGDPYPLYGHIVQRYAGITSPFFLPREPYHCFNLNNSTIDIEVKQDKENKEDMEVNEKTMPVPDGWEFDRIDESGNIVLKEKKKELPKTWLKCLHSIDDVEMIEEDSEVHKCSISDLSNDGRLFDDADRNLLPLGLGKPMLALCQLLVCRNAWWKQLGWKPDWSNATKKFCIKYTSNKICRDFFIGNNRILAFPTSEVRDQFLDTFRDLIEEAKELL